ncbi:F-box/kelch-repeat protein [Raphanus sativus]|uniref:F-box/kelch-repeat protein At5g39560-like n=1 Tax=Raphanus sativus TaxID=3726 RepID=A0A9W3CCY3_RAPSA|nr:F-box/kelch-repeat protein At5g39560-like [Raphanus sativus]KAJ4912324.1 F-box/kelch-repeat protein [Raphanus sativus]
MTPIEAKPDQTETNIKPQPLSFSLLPDEILENILARLSKWTYPNLSLVSKRFLSLLSSPELYTTRSHIGTTEPCLYFCIDESPSIPHPRWFTLWMKPADETLDDDDEILEDYSLVSVPSSPHPQHVPYFSTVAVGSDIYLIGGAYEPSSRVRIFDCRSHKWRDGPNMLVAREEAYAFYIDGKIYVMEDDRKDDNWMEVLDIKTQTWSPLLSHGATEFRDDWFLTNVYRGKIYVIAEKENFAYDPKEGTWEIVETHDCYGQIDVWCAIEDVMFCFTNSGHCMWYDTKSGEWREVKGSDMEVLRNISEYSLAWGCVVEIFNHGGKLLVIWTPRSEEYKTTGKRRISCANIAFEKRLDGEIWGKMEWVNEVLTVTKPYKFLSCLVIAI